jgi:N-acetyl-anhydromuramyl-L-alanine amidase AmpD
MGFNSQSVGICLIGGINKQGKSENNFTVDQWVALGELVIQLKERFPNAEVVGHRDFTNVAKDCPCFDVKSWYKETVENHVENNPIKRAETPAVLK